MHLGATTTATRSFSDWLANCLSPSQRANVMQNSPAGQYQIYLQTYVRAGRGCIRGGSPVAVSPPPSYAGYDTGYATPMVASMDQGASAYDTPYSDGGTYQGTGPGSSPSTMTPAPTTPVPTTPAPTTSPLVPILLFGGAGLALFLFMRKRNS